METRLLLWIHAHAHPSLDLLFVASHNLATLPFCAALVLVLVGWHLWRGERRTAFVWLLLGLAAYVAQWGLKDLFGRARPRLWLPLVPESGPALPSGHALASAALYPVLAHVLARRHPERARAYASLGVLLPLFIGSGRLYLGVHWPSDVLAGWLVGGALAALAVAHLRARPPAL